MFNYNSMLNNLVGVPFFYSDKETGVGWDIEIFEVYRESMFDFVVVVLTDNIRVKLSHIDLVRGPEQIFKRIYETYEKEIGELNG